MLWGCPCRTGDARELLRGQGEEVLCVTRAEWEGNIAGVSVSGGAQVCTECPSGEAACGIIRRPGSVGPPLAHLSLCDLRQIVQPHRASQLPHLYLGMLTVPTPQTVQGSQGQDACQAGKVLHGPWHVGMVTLLQSI